MPLIEGENKTSRKEIGGDRETGVRGSRAAGATREPEKRDRPTVYTRIISVVHTTRTAVNVYRAVDKYR